jgi:hypothetical protein
VYFEGSDHKILSGTQKVGDKNTATPTHSAPPYKFLRVNEGRGQQKRDGAHKGYQVADEGVPQKKKKKKGGAAPPLKGTPARNVFVIIDHKPHVRHPGDP